MSRKCIYVFVAALIAPIVATKAADIEQASSMSEVVKILHEQEKANRPTQKPMPEMSDEEVLAQAAEKASDTVVNIGVGALSAIERLQRKAIGAAANAIRNKDKQMTSKKSGVDQIEKNAPDVAASNTNVTATMPENDVASSVDRGSPTDEAGRQIVVLGLLALVVSAILYGIAYMRVKSGNMVVYSSWGDFAVSAAWVVLFLVGAGCRYAAEEVGDSLATAGTVFIWCGGASALWMVGGAFQNKRVIDVLFAVPARIIVAVLVLFAWSKLKESLDGIRDRRKGIVDGVLVPLGIALFVFNSLVKPMIGDRRWG